MPDLDFKIVGVEPGSNGITPILNFRAEICNYPVLERIQSILLRTQIRIQAPQRSYTAREKEKLIELFGLPSEWGKTLRNRVWHVSNTVVGAFSGSIVVDLAVPCTYDLNIAAAKYFYALEDGDVPLLFLFSGTIFYTTGTGSLQIQQISWSKEASHRMPARTWRHLMEEHFPNSAWIYLNREVFDRLYNFKRSQGLASWDRAIERLLDPVSAMESVAG